MLFIRDLIQILKPYLHLCNDPSCTTHTQLVQLTIVATVLGKQFWIKQMLKNIQVHILRCSFIYVWDRACSLSANMFLPHFTIFEIWNLATLVSYCLEFLNVFVFCIKFGIILHYVDHMPIHSIFSWFAYLINSNIQSYVWWHYGIQMVSYCYI